MGLAWKFLLAPNPIDPKLNSETTQPLDASAKSDQNGNVAPAAPGLASSGSSSPGLGSSQTSPVAVLPPAEARKIAILDEVLISKNDNDPRFDSELKDFSPEAKRAIQKKYTETAPEKRNARGTHVFLIGREIKSDEDLHFLSTVLMEKPCLSLQDCTRPPGAHSGEEEHLEALNETTANYPQLVAVRALLHRGQELIAAGQSQDPLLVKILNSLKEALASPNPRVVEEANVALKELKGE